MSATNIKVSNIFTAIFSPVLVILSVILSFLVAGNPANFQPYVKENVTTETAKITVIAENKTLNNVGDPRVRSIEKLQEGEWVTAGAYDCFTDDTFEVYKPDEADEYHPDDKDRQCSESQCVRIILKGIYGPAYRWFEPFLEILLRAYRYIHPRWDQLRHDIYNPQYPKHMKQCQFLKEVHPFQHD